jgi:hypothetical protein
MSSETQLHAPERVTDLLVQAYRLLLDAQSIADSSDRENIGVALDSCRWMIGDVIASISPVPTADKLFPLAERWELDPSPAFSNALDGGAV